MKVEEDDLLASEVSIVREQQLQTCKSANMDKNITRIESHAFCTFAAENGY